MVGSECSIWKDCLMCRLSLRQCNECVVYSSNFSLRRVMMSTLHDYDYTSKSEDVIEVKYVMAARRQKTWILLRLRRLCCSDLDRAQEAENG